MAQVKIVIQTNKSLKDGSFPVAIRMSHLNLKTQYNRINGLSAKKSQWSKALSRFKPTKCDNYKALV